MKILLTEHRPVEIKSCEIEDADDILQINEEDFARIREDSVRLLKQERGKNIYPFSLKRKNEDTFHLQADYYIGVDWLIPNVRYVQVEPKLNLKVSKLFDKAVETEDIPDKETEYEKQKEDAENKPVYVEVDYLNMLLDIMSAGLPQKDTRQLALIDWKASPIPITQKEDRLTPFIVVQFLQLLKNIVRKGLKKSYYKQRENLSNKVKGKILVGDHIKRNTLKNRLTHAYCEYQVFGEDNTENRFLKKVLRFAAAYIENNRACFAGNFTAVEHMLNYCRPAFEHISNDINERHLKQVRHNPFFNEYKEAISIGTYILKKFAYNITETSTLQKTTPPFWIDMPRLFELYCYVQILKDNPEDKDHIHYQFSTYGNSLDILISKPGCEMVIDTKYKLKYSYGHIHQDIRQLAGYARLNKVRKQLKISDDDDKNIDCLIIYPDLRADNPDYKIKTIQGKSVLIPAYYKMHKLGWTLPLIT